MIEELRTQITAVQREMVLEGPDGQSYGAHLHRLEDLIDMAARHGIDVTEWVDRSLLPE